jgi:hypothetical protein
MNEISISRTRSLALTLNLQILYFTQCIYGLHYLYPLRQFLVLGKWLRFLEQKGIIYKLQ